ncbi:UvrD-helicase domain-containing protein [Xanthomarina sp. F2636L]|uniref:UvrD-helicase domain-containing protein n=1 Tax=Xanthomarina sp. F2636L TaxID=2996018 RepID=UPI00225E33B0|nr:UvrD-helicase domain-containing protein [Xanthomarina sp. F2636L]MCX7549675.1 UvrD-helicase domain-containing protein [Xanthomarina sp. F2636L]
MEVLEQIKKLLSEKQSFLLEAGAGSGKTRTLIESLKYLIETKSKSLNDSNKAIACITYTNVAVDEINERIDNNPLVLALTIHEFLWYVIKNYQKELKVEILKYNEDESRKPIEELDTILGSQTITYSQYGRKLIEGRITHEDVIKFSARIFEKYPKMGKIVTNKFPYIFIDEYQDTEEITVKLLLDDLLTKNKGNITLGFFGDSMQKIYNQGVGEIEHENLVMVTKKDNYRCSKEVINLLNVIRPELTQNAAGDNKNGSIFFINCNNDIANADNYKKTLDFLKNKGWEFETDKDGVLNTKVLMLTHRGIANKLGYETILATYQILGRWGRERLLNKEELFANFILNKIEKFVELFEDKKYGEFIKLLGVSDYKIYKHEDKKIISDLVKTLIELRKNKSIKEVLEYVFDNSLLVKPIKMAEFIDKLDDEGNENKKSFYESLMKMKYEEFIYLYKYIEELTPFSTKHGVKGAEFENVLVVIDDDSWNQYKFNDVFANNIENQNRFNRSKNLLYVCCSRAKNNLVILTLSSMDVPAMATINNWFNGSIFNIENL